MFSQEKPICLTSSGNSLLLPLKTNLVTPFHMPPTRIKNLQQTEGKGNMLKTASAKHEQYPLNLYCRGTFR